MTLIKGDFGPPFLFRRTGRGVEKKPCDMAVQAATSLRTSRGKTAGRTGSALFREGAAPSGR